MSLPPVYPVSNPILQIHLVIPIHPFPIPHPQTQELNSIHGLLLPLPLQDDNVPYILPLLTRGTF